MLKVSSTKERWIKCARVALNSKTRMSDSAFRLQQNFFAEWNFHLVLIFLRSIFHCRPIISFYSCGFQWTLIHLVFFLTYGQLNRLDVVHEGINDLASKVFIIFGALHLKNLLAISIGKSAGLWSEKLENFLVSIFAVWSSSSKSTIKDY